MSYSHEEVERWLDAERIRQSRLGNTEAADVLLTMSLTACRGADLDAVADAVLAEVDASVSGLCESSGDGRCVVEHPTHRQIYHSERPV